MAILTSALPAGFRAALLRRARRGCRPLLLAAAIVALSGAAAAAQDTALETAVKAAYLAKFAPFVQWPGTASAPPAQFTLCVAGNETLAGLLDRAVAGQRLAGRTALVRRLHTVARDQGCQILYVSDGAAAALAAVRGAPVLTVTDNARSGVTRGMINFVLLDGHVRFEIDNAAATRSGLVISSKLLSLAVPARAAP